MLALADLSLTVARGEFVCLVGASGCGKSTLLNIVAELDKPQLGTVTRRGRVALLFQEAALFPWLTVAQNIELALRIAKVPRAEWRTRTADLLAMVQLDGCGDKRPHELSGGMRQRTAVARAIAQGADILLMDEPFGSLDAMTRDLLHDELERLWRDRGFTVLFVTHDVREADSPRRSGRDPHAAGPATSPRSSPSICRGRARMGDAAVAALAERITNRLREEVIRHADD